MGGLYGRVFFLMPHNRLDFNQLHPLKKRAVVWAAYFFCKSSK